MSRYALLIGGLALSLLIGIGVVVAESRAPSSDEGTAVTTTSSVSTTGLTVPASVTTSPTTTNPTITTTTLPPTTTTSTPPPFQSSVSTPTEAQLHSSWRPGCPLGPSELAVITMTHWNYAGNVQTGQLVVAANLADQVVGIFGDLYAAGFPIQRMEPIEAFGGDDNSSMAANNTSAFNCRQVTGGTTFSEHSYGRAIDVNPLVNPYVRGSTVLPPEGSQYVDRSLDSTGMIHAGDEVVDAFGRRGWIWGGTWSSLKDYQHFSTTGR